MEGAASKSTPMTYKKFRAGLAPNQTLIVPFTLESWLRPDHPAIALAELVDSLDLSPILDTYQELRGQPPYDPRVMVKIFIYAYSVGIRSSRRIERSLYDDVAMRFISGNQQPKFTRIAEFRRRHHEALGNILVQTVQLGKEAGLVAREHDVAVDGTKFGANASKHSAMSYAFMEEEEQRLREEIERVLTDMEHTDRIEDERYGPQKPGWTLSDELALKSKRLERITKAKAELEARAKARAEAKERERHKDAQAKGKSVEPKEPAEIVVDPKAQYNFTDPESRILRSRNDGFIQGFNGQAAVDADSMLIVAADLSTQSTDYGQLVGMIEQATQNIGAAPCGVLADAGYFSAENVAAMEGKGIEALIPPNRIPHRQWSEETGEVEVVPDDQGAKAKMREKLRRKEMRARYKRRQETVEPTFGYLKEVQGQRQELLRGEAKARSMWRFQCAIYNLMKLVRAAACPKAAMRTA
jgi:transposase